MHAVHVLTCTEMCSRLTCCIANFRTVSVELVDMGDHYNAVTHSWRQVNKSFVEIVVAQQFGFFKRLVVSVQDDTVG